MLTRKLKKYQEFKNKPSPKKFHKAKLFRIFDYSFLYFKSIFPLINKHLV